MGKSSADHDNHTRFVFEGPYLVQPVWHLKVQVGHLSLHHLQMAEGQAGLEGVPGCCEEAGGGAAQDSETSETRSAQA